MVFTAAVQGQPPSLPSKDWRRRAGPKAVAAEQLVSFAALAGVARLWLARCAAARPRSWLLFAEPFGAKRTKGRLVLGRSW